MGQAAAAASSRRRYPLAVHIATLFVALLLVAGLAIGGLAYYRSAAMLTRAADDLFDRVARETAHEVQRIVTPGEALIDVLAQTRLGTAGTLAERLDTLALLREGFAVSPHISAIYAGYANGDFFLVRRVPDAAAARKQLGAPDRAAYLVQSIERRASGGGASTFVWLDVGLERTRGREPARVRRVRPARAALVSRGRRRDRSDQDPAVRLLHHPRGRRDARAQRRRVEGGRRRGHHAPGGLGRARAPADHARDRDRARQPRRAGDRLSRRRARAPGRRGRRGPGAGPARRPRRRRCSARSPAGSRPRASRRPRTSMLTAARGARWSRRFRSRGFPIRRGSCSRCRSTSCSPRRARSRATPRRPPPSCSPRRSCSPSSPRAPSPARSGPWSARRTRSGASSSRGRSRWPPS